MKNIKKQYDEDANLTLEQYLDKLVNKPFQLMVEDEWGNPYVLAYGVRADLEAILAVTSPDRKPEIVPNN